ncbi:MAG: hypothetical protein HQK91_13525 [Nitrospirae bacterium]|nr:hypothetical protein [Nitrospirota bacterium]
MKQVQDENKTIKEMVAKEQEELEKQGYNVRHIFVKKISSTLNDDNDEETYAAGGLVTGEKGIAGKGEFVINRSATEAMGSRFLSSINNFQLSAMPKMPDLHDLKNGSQYSGNNYIVELHLPNDKTYPMKTTEETFKQLAQEYHFRGPSQKSTTFSEFLEKRFGW